MTTNDILPDNENVEQAVPFQYDQWKSILDQHNFFEDFLWLTSFWLQDFIHARIFDGNASQQEQIVGTEGKLNKTCYRCQMASDIEQDCSSS